MLRGPNGGLSQAQVQAAATAALEAANLSSIVLNAVVSASSTIASAVANLTGVPNPNVQRVSGSFSGADTELQILTGFEGYAYRIYGIKITCKTAASDVTICCGEVGSSSPIGPSHRLAIGGELHDGRTEFVGLFDTVPNLSVILRKTTASELIYELDFDYIYV